MISKRVSHRYAKALLQFAVELDIVDRVSDDMKMLRSVISSSRDLQLFLTTPVVPELTKERILKQIFADKLCDMVSRFVTLLAHKGRSADLYGVTEAFSNQVFRHRKVVPTEVTVAAELAPEQKQHVEERISAMCGRPIETTYSIDPQIIGGFMARFEDTMIDASVRHQLDRMHQALTGGTGQWKPAL